MRYRLKKGVEAFQIVDGPFAGRKYERGKTYKEVPPREHHRFEEAGPEAAEGTLKTEDSQTSSAPKGKRPLNLKRVEDERP